MLILLLQVASTWFMTGLIWFVQVVHYPLYDRVGSEAFSRYELDHTHLTTLVVGPAMLIELLTAAWLLGSPPEGVSAWQTWSGMLLLGIIWGSTALLQVPQHGILATAFDETAYTTLVSTNWIRTLAWTLRGGVVLSMLYTVLMDRP